MRQITDLFFRGWYWYVVVYPVRINDRSEGGCARGGIDDDDDGDDDVDDDGADDVDDNGAGAVVDADGGARDGNGADEPVGGGVGGSSGGASGRTGVVGSGS